MRILPCEITNSKPMVGVAFGRKVCLKNSDPQQKLIYIESLFRKNLFSWNWKVFAESTVNKA